MNKVRMRVLSKDLKKKRVKVIEVAPPRTSLEQAKKRIRKKKEEEEQNTNDNNSS